MYRALATTRGNSDASIVLDGDRQVTIRPLGRDDASALTAFYAGLSPEARCQRFFHFHRVTADEGQRMAAIEDENGVVVVAVIDDGGSCRLADGAAAIICSASDEESCEILAAHEGAPAATPLFVVVGPEQSPPLHRAAAIDRSGTPDDLLDTLDRHGVHSP